MGQDITNDERMQVLRYEPTEMASEAASQTVAEPSDMLSEVLRKGG